MISEFYDYVTYFMRWGLRDSLSLIANMLDLVLSVPGSKSSDKRQTFRVAKFICFVGNSSRIVCVSPSHRPTVNVLLNNITFYDFCCFRCVTHCMSPL